MSSKKDIDRFSLVALYERENSLSDIAKLYECSTSTISNKFKEFGLKVRSKKDEQKLRFKLKPESHGWKGKRHKKETLELFSNQRFGKQRGIDNPSYKHGRDSGKWYRRYKGHRCELCGTKDKLVVHHKDGDHYNNNGDNWQTLCHKCHITIHCKKALDNNKIKDLYDMGYSANQVSKQLGVSKYTILSRLKEMKVTRRTCSETRHLQKTMGV